MGAGWAFDLVVGGGDAWMRVIEVERDRSKDSRDFAKLSRPCLLIYCYWSVDERACFHGSVVDIVSTHRGIDNYSHDP